MLDREVQKRIVLEELVIVIHLRRDKIALPVFVDVILNRILQSSGKLHAFALDGNHESVGTAETLIRFFESPHTRRIFGQEVRKVSVEFQPRLHENRKREEESEEEIKR